MLKSRICRICNILKSHEEFTKNKPCIDGITHICIKCGYKKRKESKPWMEALFRARRRCNHKKNNSYRNYGAKGIKCLLTGEEIKTLWFRDKAFEMKIPSIDRIDSKGNYILDNCRFIEKSLNSKLNGNYRKTECFRGHKFTPENTRFYGKLKTYRECRICKKNKRLKPQRHDA